VAHRRCLKFANLVFVLIIPEIESIRMGRNAFKPDMHTTLALWCGRDDPRDGRDSNSDSVFPSATPRGMIQNNPESESRTHIAIILEATRVSLCGVSSTTSHPGVDCTSGRKVQAIYSQPECPPDGKAAGADGSDCCQPVWQVCLVSRIDEARFHLRRALLDKETREVGRSQ
jgi:hypothetical protein